MRRENGGVLKLSDLPSKMCRLKHVGENLTEEERAAFLRDSYPKLDDEVDFELFLRVNQRLCYIRARLNLNRAIKMSIFEKCRFKTFLSVDIRRRKREGSQIQKCDSQFY